MTNIMFGMLRICSSRFKWNYLKNGKLFLNVFFHFWNLHQILNILKRNVIVPANVFPKLQNVKIMNKLFSKELRFKTKHFPHFLLLIWNFHQILNILKTKMIVIFNVFSKLQVLKVLVELLSKKFCVRASFDSQPVKVSQIFIKIRMRALLSYLFISLKGTIF